ncbi:MAG: patatin-like phospholipase family protein, partial [Paracoccaceae bacterium]
DKLWSDVARLGDFRANPWVSAMFPFAAEWAEAWQAAVPVSGRGVMEQFATPYAYGPLWQNPLARVVARLDFSKVCADDGPQLHISTTNVRTGKIRVFAGAEVSADVLLASACLPSVFKAVEVTDPKTGVREAYWDGGYSGNPALFPLYRPELPDDVVIVSINPLRRDEIPQTPVDIQNRIDEISFNASLLSELRAVNFVRRLIADGRMEKGVMKDVLVHLIADDDLMNALSGSTKLTPLPGLLARLKAAGQAAAERFLIDHRAKIGKQSSIDLPGLFG